MDESDTLEFRLRKKLEDGEISEEEFNELYFKFRELGILDARAPPTHKKKAWIINGSKSIEQSTGVNGSVTVNGALRVSGSLECMKLNIRGSVSVREDLTVIGKTSVNGKLSVGGKICSGDKISISGKLEVDDELVTTSSLKVAGNVNVGANVLAGGKIKVGGKLSARSLECAQSIKIMGRVKIKGNCIAEEFISTSNSDSIIEGRLMAKKIKIGTEKSQRASVAQPELNHVVQQLISSLVLNRNKGKFRIKGGIEGENIFLSNVDLEGDLRGDNITIGEGVTLNGVIYYTTSLSLPENQEYSFERVAS